MKPLPTPTTPAPLHRDEHPAAPLAPSYPGHLLLLLALLAAGTATLWVWLTAAPSPRAILAPTYKIPYSLIPGRQK